MRHRRSFGCAIVLFLTFLPAVANGFDGSRSGVYAGPSWGVGSIRLQGATVGQSGFNQIRFTDNGITGAFEIGYGVNESWQVGIVQHAVWNLGIEDNLVVSQHGLGIRHYFSEQAPSMTLAGGIGLAVVYGNHPGSTGLGLWIESGCEIVKHWPIELGVSYSRFIDTIDTPFSLDYERKREILTCIVTFGYRAY